jgi:hypothetical protein
MTSPSTDYYVVLHDLADADHLAVLKLLRVLLKCGPAEAKAKLLLLPLYLDFTWEAELAEETYKKLEATGAVVSAFFGGPVRSNSELIRRRKNVPYGFWRGVETDPLVTPTTSVASFVSSVTMKGFEPHKNDLRLRVYVDRAINERDRLHFEESSLERYKEYLSSAGVKGLQIMCEFIEVERPRDSDEEEIWRRRSQRDSM